jgi:hypothetical protein
MFGNACLIVAVGEGLRIHFCRDITAVFFSSATAVEKWCVAGEGMKIHPLDQLHGFWMCLGFSRLYSMFFPLQWARAPADPIMLQMKAFKAFLGEKQRKSTSQSYPYVRDISCWICPGSVSLIISCFFWSVASLQPSHATIGAPTLGRPSEL